MNLLKKVTKKIIAFILIILIIGLTCTPKVTFASSTTATTADSSGMTEDQLRDSFVNAIVGFYNQHGSQCSYNLAGRAKTYINGANAGTYQFDCVGWVSCAFHWFLRIGSDTAFTIFVDPTKNAGYAEDDTAQYISGIGSQYFQRINDISQAKKGDVLVYKQRGNKQHVAIYIGNGQVLDMRIDGLGIRSINDTYAWDFVAHLYNFEGVTFTPIEDGAELPEEGEEEGGNWDVDEVDLDEIAELFQYDGMPPTMIYQDEKVDVFRWIFDGISGFMDFIAGLLISFIKMPILGFAAMFDNFIDSLISGMN